MDEAHAFLSEYEGCDGNISIQTAAAEANEKYQTNIGGNFEHRESRPFP
jgi:hypothetical protein